MMALGALFLCLTCMSNLEERQEKIKDKQIDDWTALSQCTTETLVENMIYNARLIDVIDENHMRIMIKHQTRMESYTMRLLNCEVVDKIMALIVLNRQKEDLLGLCSVYIHHYDEEAGVWYISFSDRFKQSLNSKLYKAGAAVCNFTIFSKNQIFNSEVPHLPTIPEHPEEEKQKDDSGNESTEEMKVPPVSPISESVHDSIDSLSELQLKNITDHKEKHGEMKEEITIMFPIQRQVTMPIIIDNGVPIVERRCGSETVDDKIEEHEIEPVVIYRKSITMPYIVEEIGTEEFPYQKKVTMPYIVQ